jgi:hypothetical protein
VDSSRAETVSFPYVERQELMGGTLTATSHSGSSSVADPGSYIGALLGPERTRCFVFDQRR